jgi:hypothetical protein
LENGGRGARTCDKDPKLTNHATTGLIEFLQTEGRIIAVGRLQKASSVRAISRLKGPASSHLQGNGQPDFICGLAAEFSDAGS